MKKWLYRYQLYFYTGFVVLLIGFLVYLTLAQRFVAPAPEPTVVEISRVTLIVRGPPEQYFETLSIEEPTDFISLGEFTLTAYCPCVICCEIWSAEHPSRIGTDFIQRTASGTIPTAGRTIATDTSVIPFGTIVLINGHEYIAEDRGGAIVGNIIDIFFDCHQEALTFGRQTAEVFIKGE